MTSLFSEEHNVNWKWFAEKGWVLTRTKRAMIWEFEKGSSEIRIRVMSSSIEVELFHQSKLIVMLIIGLEHITLASETIKTMIENFINE